MPTVAGYHSPQPELPTTWGFGAPLTQHALNGYSAHILDLYTQCLGGFRTAKPMCLVIAADAGGIPNQTDTVITFQTGAQDTDGMYTATSPTQLTIQTSGWYRIMLQVHWDTTVAGHRSCKVLVNGTDPLLPGVAVATDAGDLGVSGEGTVTTCEAFAHLNAGSTVYGNVWQSSGTVLHFVTVYSGTFMSAEWIAP